MIRGVWIESMGTVRRVAAYGAALAMLPYFVIKIFWTVDGLRGGGLHEGAWSTLNWAAINGLTVAMSGLGILLGLALAQRWGMRVPGGVMVLPAWIGFGFLVPMIPILPVLLLFATGDTGSSADGGDPTLPVWEVRLVAVSFAGFALGSALAVPLYAAQRWPAAFSHRPAAGPPGEPVRSLALLASAVCVALGLPQLFWALGGTAGLDPATLDNRDAQWHVLTANNGGWALVAAWAVWAVARRGGRIALLFAWAASGFLFAWGSWKAAFTYAVVPTFPPPEYTWVLALQNHFGALVGMAILVVLLLTLEQRWWPRGDSNARHPL